MSDAQDSDPKKPKLFTDPNDGPYIGNFFGWKVSLIGAIVILGLIAWAAYRHYTLDAPFGMEDPQEENYTPVDTFAGEEIIDTLNAGNE